MNTNRCKALTKKGKVCGNKTLTDVCKIHRSQSTLTTESQNGNHSEIHSENHSVTKLVSRKKPPKVVTYEHNTPPTQLYLFARLPNDLNNKILNLLNHDDLISFALSNKSCNALVNTPKFWHVRGHLMFGKQSPLGPRKMCIGLMRFDFNKVIVKKFEQYEHHLAFSSFIRAVKAILMPIYLDFMTMPLETFDDIMGRNFLNLQVPTYWVMASNLYFETERKKSFVIPLIDFLVEITNDYVNRIGSSYFSTDFEDFDLYCALHQNEPNPLHTILETFGKNIPKFPFYIDVRTFDLNYNAMPKSMRKLQMFDDPIGGFQIGLNQLIIFLTSTLDFYVDNMKVIESRGRKSEADHPSAAVQIALDILQCQHELTCCSSIEKNANSSSIWSFTHLMHCIEYCDYVIDDANGNPIYVTDLMAKYDTLRKYVNREQ